MTIAHIILTCILPLQQVSNFLVLSKRKSYHNTGAVNSFTIFSVFPIPHKPETCFNGPFIEENGCQLAVLPIQQDMSMAVDCITKELKDAFMYHSYLADKIEVRVLRGEMKRPTQAYTYGLQYSGTEMNFSRL